MEKRLSSRLCIVSAVSFVLVLLGGIPRALGASDQAPSSIDWATVSTTAPIYYVDSSDDRLYVWYGKALLVDSGFIGSHCMTSGGQGIAHSHWQHDLGDGNAPVASEVESLVGYMLGTFATDGPTSHGGATNLTNCYCFAAYHASGGGVYNYWINDMSIVLSSDFSAETPATLAPGDLAYYARDGESVHASEITTVSSSTPKHVDAVLFKYGAGGLYTDTYGTYMESPGELALYTCWVSGQTLTYNIDVNAGGVPEVLLPSYYH